jgi:acyl-CoA thioesterase-1
MKVSFPLSLAVVFLSMAGSNLAANPETLAPAKQTAVSPKQAAVPPEFVAITDDPSLPRVLLMGDSVSIAYALEVRKALKGKANVHRVPANCGSTKTALGSYGLVRWIADEHAKWDVIHFNWGLHDLKHVKAPGSNEKSDNPADPVQASVETYGKNMEQIVAKLKATSAKLIFATTTPVQPGTVNPLREPEAPKTYNAVAVEIAKKEGASINDLFSFCQPRLTELQLPLNVHFTPAGSQALAEQVANAILTKLPQQPNR